MEKSDTKRSSRSSATFPLRGDERKLYRYQDFIREYVDVAAKPAFRENVKRLFPGYRWTRTEDGNWISLEFPNSPDFGPQLAVAEVFVGDPTNVEEEDDWDSVEAWFSPVRAIASPFCVDVEWEDDDGLGYEYPEETTVWSGLGPCRKDLDRSWVRQCLNLFIFLAIPVPRLRYWSAATVKQLFGQVSKEDTLMQIQMQAFGRKPESLRKLITADLRPGTHGSLALKESQNKERANGWAKVTGKDMSGALNIEWDSDQQMLIVRAISRGKGNSPHRLLAVFVQYLVERFGNKIGSINMQLLDRK